MSERNQKVASIIQASIGEATTEIFKDNRLGLITITRVEVNSDRSEAKVFFSVLDPKITENSALEYLNKRRSKMQTIISRKIQTRKSPRLRIEIDKNPNYVSKIDEILAEIKSEKK